MGGTFYGAFYGVGSGTNIFTNVTIIGTNTPIWNADGNIFPPSAINIYSGTRSPGLPESEFLENQGRGNKRGTIFRHLQIQGDLTLTGALRLNDDGAGTYGIPDFGSCVLEVADDVNHGIVQQAISGNVWVYQLFSAPSGGNPTNSFYTNGMETMQILADGQIELLQPWQYEDGPHVNLLFSEAQPGNYGKSTGKTNTFGMEVYNGLLSISSG